MSEFYDSVEEDCRSMYVEQGTDVTVFLSRPVAPSSTPWNDESAEVVVPARCMYLPPVGTNFGNRCLRVEGLLSRDSVMCLIITDNVNDFMFAVAIEKDGKRYNVKAIDTMYKGAAPLLYELACSR